MTDLYVIRLNRQKDELINRLKERQVPFKLLIQDMWPIRTVDQNAYYFGVVCSMIADFTGHTPDEVHEYLALMFRIKYYFNGEEMVFERTTTTRDDINSFSDYVEKCCAWAWFFLGIQIPHPWELINQDEVNAVVL